MTWRSLDRVGNLSSASVLHVFARHAARPAGRPGRLGGADGDGSRVSAPNWCCCSGEPLDDLVHACWSAWSRVERLAELVVAKRNLAWSLARGGRETGFGHYPFMVVLHTGLLAGCLLEVWLGDRPFLPALGWPMLALVVASQALRWWCIRTLGPQWNTRIVVVPGLPRVTGGPYRLLPHPNYVAVVVEGVRAAAGAHRVDHRGGVHRRSTPRC